MANKPSYVIQKLVQENQILKKSLEKAKKAYKDEKLKLELAWIFPDDPLTLSNHPTDTSEDEDDTDMACELIQENIYLTNHLKTKKREYAEKLVELEVSIIHSGINDQSEDEDTSDEEEDEDTSDEDTSDEDTSDEDTSDEEEDTAQTGEWADLAANLTFLHVLNGIDGYYEFLCSNPKVLTMINEPFVKSFFKLMKPKTMELVKNYRRKSFTTRDLIMGSISTNQVFSVDDLDDINFDILSCTNIIDNYDDFFDQYELERFAKMVMKLKSSLK